MYLTSASDTFCGGDLSDTPRIIPAMTSPTTPPWSVRAQARMRELKLTQNHLIPVFGVTTRGAVGHYFTGRRDPTVEQMIALARTLNMSLDELLLGEPPSSQPARLNVSRLVSSIETLEGAIEMSKVRLSTRARARMLASLYAEATGAAPDAAAAVKTALASLLTSMEDA